jgi:ABC-type amino acid transport substrate-binding protein
MQKISVILTSAFVFGAVGISQASPLDSPDTVYIDGQPCNSACQSYMAWSRQVMPVPGQPPSVTTRAAVHRQIPKAVGGPATRMREAGSKPAASDRIAKPPAPAFTEVPHTKVTDVQPGGKASAASDTAAPKIANSVSMVGAATHSTTRTTLEQVTAAMAVAERLTAATSVAIVVARPEIKSMSDLAGKSIAVDNGQSTSSSSVRTAIVKAGAAEVQLTENQTKALDRVLGGDVLAAVLTLASPEAAEGFPEITGFNIFRIPLTPEISRVKNADLQPAAPAAAASDAAQAKIAELRPSGAIATGSHTKTTRELVTAAMAVAERMTAAVEDPRGSEQNTKSADRSDRSETAPSNDTNPRTVVLIARPEIKSVADLAGKEIAIDHRLSGPSGNLRTAIAAAGAAEVQLAKSQTKAIDRVIVGEVPAAVLTLASPEAAEGFPEVAGFRVFRIPLSPSSTLTSKP